jgi:hypothetical protein
MNALFALSVLAAYGLYRAAKTLGKRLKRARELQEEAEKLKNEYGRRTGNTPD